jgi:hypothetical protein
MVYTSDFQVLYGMMLAMGCDASQERALKLYERYRDHKVPSDILSLSLTQYAQIVNAFVDEDCDPVDGVIETIRDKYDPEGTGLCKFD